MEAYKQNIYTYKCMYIHIMYLHYKFIFLDTCMYMYNTMHTCIMACTYGTFWDILHNSIIGSPLNLHLFNGKESWIITDAKKNQYFTYMYMYSIVKTREWINKPVLYFKITIRTHATKYIVDILYNTTVTKNTYLALTFDTYISVYYKNKTANRNSVRYKCLLTLKAEAEGKPPEFAWSAW